MTPRLVRVDTNQYDYILMIQNLGRVVQESKWIMYGEYLKYEIGRKRKFG